MAALCARLVAAVALNALANAIQPRNEAQGDSLSYDAAQSNPGTIPLMAKALRSMNPLESISVAAALVVIGLQIATDGIGIFRSTWLGVIVLLGGVVPLLFVALQWRGARRRRAGRVGTHERTRR